MRIRPFHPGDEPALRAVFHSSVHQRARQHYTAAQLQAWAPAELDGRIAGFADLQPSGTIDHFFVAGDYAGHGVGRALMVRIHQAAEQAAMPQLWAHVSLCAEPFFSRNGFVVKARQQVEVRGMGCWRMRAWASRFWFDSCLRRMNKR